MRHLRRRRQALAKNPGPSRLCYRGKKINERRLNYRSGSEGCQHDPYGWEELIVHQNGHKITLRLGSLGYLRLSIDDVPVKRDAHDRDPEAQNHLMSRFVRLTGFTADSFMEAWNKTFASEALGGYSQHLYQR